MRKFVRVALAAGLMGGILVSTTVEAKKPSGGDRTEVCHRTGQTFTPKSVSADSVAGHEGHGDGFPLGVVPGQPGMKFDATCNSVPFRTVYIAGPEGGAEGGAIQAALTAFDRVAGTSTVYIATPVQILIDAAVGSGEAPEVVDPATGDPITVDLLIVPQPLAISALADSGAAVPASAADRRNRGRGMVDLVHRSRLCRRLALRGSETRST